MALRSEWLECLPDSMGRANNDKGTGRPKGLIHLLPYTQPYNTIVKVPKIRKDFSISCGCPEYEPLKSRGCPDVCVFFLLFFFVFFL